MVLHTYAYLYTIYAGFMQKTRKPAFFIELKDLTRSRRRHRFCIKCIRCEAIREPANPHSFVVRWYPTDPLIKTSPTRSDIRKKRASLLLSQAFADTKQVETCECLRCKRYSESTKMISRGPRKRVGAKLGEINRRVIVSGIDVIDTIDYVSIYTILSSFKYMRKRAFWTLGE